MRDCKNCILCFRKYKCGVVWCGVCVCVCARVCGAIVKHRVSVVFVQVYMFIFYTGTCHSASTSPPQVCVYALCTCNHSNVTLGDSDLPISER